MHWISPIFGSLIIAAGMTDLARTLFHPSGSGNVSDFLTLRLWRAVRRSAPRMLGMAGPSNFLVVILYWGLSVVVGFALIYRPFIPGQFVLSTGMDTARFAAHPWPYSLSLSLASLITVTLGMETNSPALQIAMGIEAVMGFVILTASISWILSIYGVIENRRSLAHEASLLHFMEEHGIKRLEQMEHTDLQSLLVGLAAQITTIRTELSQFPITYYFQESDDQSAMAPALYFLAEVAEDVAGSKKGAVVGATLLGGAIDDLLEMISRKFLKQRYADRWAALDALNADHLREPLHHPGQIKAA